MAIESKNKKEKKKKYKSWAFILYISDEQQEHTYLFDSMREHKKKKAVYAHASHVYSQDLSPSICLSFCRAHSFSAFTSTLTLLFLIE